MLTGPLLNDNVEELPLLPLTAWLPLVSTVLFETMVAEELCGADEEAVDNAELVDSVLLEAEEGFAISGLLREPDGLAPAELSNLVELTEDS